MKKILFIGWVIASACHTNNQQVMDNFIPGMYVREFESEYAKGSDTLILRREMDNQYTILKRSGFQRIKNGILQEKEFRQELWSGEYYPEQEVMEEFKRGKLIYFKPQEKKLLLGASEYRKVK